MICADYATCAAVTYDESQDYDCQHHNFPKVTLSERLGAAVPECCPFHGYFGLASCDARDGEEMVRDVPNVPVCQVGRADFIST